METDLLRTMTVDYQRLSEIYAGFLVAVGSVSITVITLILILPPSKNTETSNKIGADKRRNRVVMKHMRTSRTFLVTALLVATVSCFIGAHMMAETAASISYSNQELKEAREKAFVKADGKLLDDQTEQGFKEQKKKSSGERLFLLASSNIFIATILVLFALMLIPGASRKRSILRVREISFKIFLLVTIVIIYWMVLAFLYRMPTPYTVYILISAVIPLVVCPYFYFVIQKNNFYFLLRKKIFSFLVRKNNFFYFLIRKNINDGLNVVFFPIVLFTASLLGYFAWSFDNDSRPTTFDVFLVCFGVSVSYGFILAAGLKIGWRDLRKQYLKATNAEEPVVEAEDGNGDKKPDAENKTHDDPVLLPEAGEPGLKNSRVYIFSSNIR